MSRIKLLVALSRLRPSPSSRSPRASMMSQNQVIQKLQSLWTIISQKDKQTSYQTFLQELLTERDATKLAANIHAFVDAIITQDQVGLVVGRQLLGELVKGLQPEGSIADRDARKTIIEDTLEIIQPKLVSFEEQVCFSECLIGPCIFERSNDPFYVIGDCSS
jgi:hypothetical protein